MSEKWIESCRAALEKIRNHSDIENPDRLSLLRSIKTSLTYIGRSLSGWSKLVNNPNTMAKFSKKELEEIEEVISDFAESFVKQDIKTTKLSLDKGLKIRKETQRKRTRFVI